jgi:hypothetical protein
MTESLEHVIAKLESLPASEQNALAKGVIAITESLERAISKLKALPPSEQDALASIILEELEDDRRWNQSSSLLRSPDALAKLGATAMVEYHAGKTQELNPDTL